MKRSLMASAALGLLLALPAPTLSIAQTGGTSSPSGTPSPGNAKPDSASPGNSSTAPGQNRPPATTNAPGRSESAPGQNRPPATTNAPGRSESAPGQNRSDAQPGADRPGANAPGRTATDKPGEMRRNGSRETTQSGENPGQKPGASGRTGDTRNPSDRDQRAGDNQRGDTNINVNLDATQRTRVTQAFTSVNVKPVTNVNFAVSVGTVVDRGISFHTLPPAVVEIVPQFRGYSYFVVRDEIVIVEPRTRRIVYVMDRRGGSASRGDRGHATLSIGERQRKAIHQRMMSGPRVTQSLQLREDMIVPSDIELRVIDQPIIAEVPEIRPYRYFVYNDQVVLVEPDSRRVVEIIR